MLSNGQACTKSSDCISGICAGGYCCATECSVGVINCISGVQNIRSCSTGTCSVSTVSCGGYGCALGGMSCKSGCSSDSDYAPGYNCFGSSCKKQLGSTCSKDDECYNNGTTTVICRSGKCVIPSCPSASYQCQGCSSSSHCESVNGKNVTCSSGYCIYY